MSRPPDSDRFGADRTLVDQCQVCGAPLGPNRRSCTACGAEQHPPPARRSAAQRPLWRRTPWIPAGIAAGGLAAILGGALVGVLLLGDPDASPDLAGASGRPTPSPEATGDASPEASASPYETPAPSGDPTPTPVIAEVIPNRAIAEVTTDELNLRAAASRTADILGVLKREQRLFVIGEPSQDGDLNWYRVAMVNDPVQCAEACGLIGFVATPLTEDHRWIAEREADCPESPMTAEALARLQPLEALSCYGRDEIAITGTMELPFHGSMSPYDYRPAWMRPAYTAYMRHAWWLNFVAPPDSGLGTPDHGMIVHATGNFEHPSAVDCRATVNPDFFGGELPEDFPIVEHARVVLDCRATFVWTGYEVLGTEVVPTPTAGPVPDNDAPSGAIEIHSRRTFTADTTGAATEPEEPCLNPEEGGTYPIGKTTWWSFIGNGSGFYTIVDTGGSDFDTILGLYRDDGDGRLTPLACVDDVHDSLQAYIEVRAEAGVRYLVQVGGYGGQSGNLRINIDDE